MRILLTGATGAVGSRVLVRLLERGHRVTATTRSADALVWLRGLGAGAVLLDDLDPVAVGEVVGRSEPDVIVHQPTGPGGTSTDHLVSAAQAAGVRRFVVQSCAPALALACEEPVTEARLDGVVLRHGNLYGHEEFDLLARRVRRRRLPVVGDGRGVWSWVHVDDAAAATVAAIDREAVGTYCVVDDDPASVAEWLPYLAALLGAKEPRTVPRWLGRLLLGDVATRRLTEGCGTSNAHAKRDLDWRPAWASWRDGFPYALARSQTISPRSMLSVGTKPSRLATDCEG